jgi:putative spermidine/putrescine transport system permease protein
MFLTLRARIGLRVMMVVGLLILYVPLALVVLNSFNKSHTYAFPPTGYTTQWWRDAVHNEGALAGLRNSVKVGLGATVIALVLGSMAAVAVSRYKFFGRSTISFLVVLPIALPGIVTGIALQNAFQQVSFIHFGLLTVIIGHATFCIVIVFNNVQARLARVGGSLGEASSDLGATSWQTFRFITLPTMRGALVAASLLAFGLSFDEIVVTTFTTKPGLQTLPLWIYNNLSRPNQAPIVNVVAAALIVLAVLPVWVAQRLSDDVTGSRF